MKPDELARTIKPPLCPHCHQPLRFLKMGILGFLEYKVEVKNRQLCYDLLEVVEWQGEAEFWCPHCGQIVAWSEDEALELLTRRDLEVHGAGGFDSRNQTSKMS